MTDMANAAGVCEWTYHDGAIGQPIYQIVNIPTKEPTSWRRDQKLDGSSAATNETRPSATSVPIPSLTDLKKKLHMCGGVVQSQGQNQQNSSMTLPDQSTLAPTENEDILTKFRGLLKRLPVSAQSKRQPETNIDAPKVETSGEKQPSVKPSNNTAEVESSSSRQENDVTGDDRLANDRLDIKNSSDVLSCRHVDGLSRCVSVREMCHPVSTMSVRTVNITPVATVAATVSTTPASTINTAVTAVVNAAAAVTVSTTSAAAIRTIPATTASKTMAVTVNTPTATTVSTLPAAMVSTLPAATVSTALDATVSTVAVTTVSTMPAATVSTVSAATIITTSTVTVSPLPDAPVSTSPTSTVRVTPAVNHCITPTVVSSTTLAAVVTTTPAVVFIAADLSSDSSVSGTEHHGPCKTTSASVRKPRKRKPNKVHLDSEETAATRPFQRSECPVVAVTPCRPVENSPEKMHPEIICRLQTDLHCARPAPPVAIPLYSIEPSVDPLAIDEQPLDLSKTVWPAMLPLDLSKKEAPLKVPDLTVATRTFTSPHPRPPALGIRPPPQKVSPVRPIQRQPLSRTAATDRVAAAAKAGFWDGANLRKFLSQRVRTAVDKLHFNNGLSRRDMSTPLCRVGAGSPANTRRHSKAETSSEKPTVTASSHGTDMSGSQCISTLTSTLANLAQRLGCSVQATEPRSTCGSLPTTVAQERTRSEGTLQSRFTAPRRKARHPKPPMAEVRPISARQPVDWKDNQQRVSHNVDLAIVEPSKHRKGGGTGHLGQRQLCSASGARTYNVSVSRAVTRSSMISHNVITIIDTSPVLVTTKSSSGSSVLATWKSDSSEPAAAGESEELPGLSPPKLHMVSPPSVAVSNVGNTVATSQMPELSPHADETAVVPIDSSDGPAMRQSLSPPPLLVYGASDGQSTATTSYRADVSHSESSASKAVEMSTAAIERAAMVSANSNMDLAVFIPTKPFSIDLFSRCVDTWAEDIARPSRAGSSVRHRSTFDIGRTNYYKNTILCQQTPATTYQAERRLGGRHPVAPAASSRHAGGTATHESCRQYHRDCRLPTSIIASLPTLPPGYGSSAGRRSPKMARTVASVKRAVTANVAATNAGPSPAKMGRMYTKKSPLSSGNNVSPKMARTVASVRQELRACHKTMPAPSGVSHKTSSTIVHLKSSERQQQQQKFDWQPNRSTNADMSDPELSCSSARYGYARKAMGHLETDPIADQLHKVETSPKKVSGTKRVVVSPRHEPVVSNYSNSNARSVEPLIRIIIQKPKAVAANKHNSDTIVTSAKLFKNAVFPQLDAHAAEKAVATLIPPTHQKPESVDSGPVSEKGRSSSQDDPVNASDAYTPSSLRSDVAPDGEGKASARDAVTPMINKHKTDNRSPAMARTVSKIMLRHSYPVVKLERVETGLDQTVVWKCVTKQTPGVEQKRVRMRPLTRSSSGTVAENLASPRGNGATRTYSSSGSGVSSVRSRLRRPPTDRRISSSSSSSCGSQHRKRRSLLDELSNTDGYVGDEARRRSDVDLFADPSTLSREERALQRAMIKFTEMEMGLCRKGKTKTKSKKEETRRTSERNNATGRCSWKRYHKDRAYEQALHRERQRRQRIRERRQARLLSNEQARDDSQPTATVDGDQAKVVSAKPKRKAFSWNSPYWKGSRSRSLKKKLYGCRSKKVQSGVNCQPELVIETDATVDTYESTLDRHPALSTESHELPRENTCDVETTGKTVLCSQNGDRVLTIPPDVKKLGVCRDVGETVLHRAARLGYKEVALWCCQTGYVDVNTPDNAGFTPLHETCIGGHVAIAKTLLAYGADINVASRLDGVRPIHDAVEHDQVEMVRLLLSCGADTSLSTYSGSTLFTIAHSKEMKQFLHGFFADLNGTGKQQTILTTSWEFDRYNCAKLDGDEQEEEEEENEETGCDVFDHLPSEETESAGDIQLELNDKPHIPTYNISFSHKEGSRNFVLLRDVLEHLNIDRASFMKRGGGKIQLRRLSMAKFLYRTQHCQSLGFRYNDDTNSHVELMEWDNALRSMLGVEVVTLRDGVVLGGQGDKGDNGSDVVQGDTYCSSRPLDSPQQGKPHHDTALPHAPVYTERVAARFPDATSYEYDFGMFDEMALMQQSYAINADATRQTARRNTTEPVQEDLSNVYGPSTRIRIENGQVRVLCDTNGRRLSPRVYIGSDLVNDATQPIAIPDWTWQNPVACAVPTALSPYPGTRAIGDPTLIAEKYPHCDRHPLPEAEVQSLACTETETTTTSDDGECMLKIANVCTLRGSKAMQVFAPDSPVYTAALPP